MMVVRRVRMRSEQRAEIIWVMMNIQTLGRHSFRLFLLEFMKNGILLSFSHSPLERE